MLCLNTKPCRSCEVDGRAFEVCSIEGLPLKYTELNKVEMYGVRKRRHVD